MDKLSEVDNLSIELHKSNINSAKISLELQNTKLSLLVARLYRKYKLEDDDIIMADGTIKKSTEEPQINEITS